MKKQEFLNILSNNLNLPKQDREEILYDYKEHFDIGYEKGKTDEEIVKELGDPKKIAKQYMASEFLEVAKENPTVKNLSSAIIAALGLGFFNLTFVLAFVIAGAALGFALLATAGAITVSGVAFIILPIFKGVPMVSVPDIPYIQSFFIGTALMSFGILAFRGMLYINKKFYKMVLKYIQKNIEIIKG